MDKTTMTKLYSKVFSLLRQHMKTVDYMTFEQSLLEIINKSNKGVKEEASNLKIDNLKRRMKKTILAKNLLKQHNRHLKEWLPHKVKVDIAKILSKPKTYE